MKFKKTSHICDNTVQLFTHEPRNIVKNVTVIKKETVF